MFFYSEVNLNQVLQNPDLIIPQSEKLEKKSEKPSRIIKKHNKIKKFLFVLTGIISLFSVNEGRKQYNMNGKYQEAMNLINKLQPEEISNNNKKFFEKLKSSTISIKQLNGLNKKILQEKFGKFEISYVIETKETINFDSYFDAFDILQKTKNHSNFNIISELVNSILFSTFIKTFKFKEKNENQFNYNDQIIIMKLYQLGKQIIEKNKLREFQISNIITKMQRIFMNNLNNGFNSETYEFSKEFTQKLICDILVDLKKININFNSLGDILQDLKLDFIKTEINKYYGNFMKLIENLEFNKNEFVILNFLLPNINLIEDFLKQKNEENFNLLKENFVLFCDLFKEEFKTNFNKNEFFQDIKKYSDDFFNIIFFDHEAINNILQEIPKGNNFDNFEKELKTRVSQKDQFLLEKLNNLQEIISFIRINERFIDFLKNKNLEKINYFLSNFKKENAETLSNDDDFLEFKLNLLNFIHDQKIDIKNLDNSLKYKDLFLFEHGIIIELLLLGDKEKIEEIFQEIFKNINLKQNDTRKNIIEKLKNKFIELTEYYEKSNENITIKTSVKNTIFDFIMKKYDNIISLLSLNINLKRFIEKNKNINKLNNLLEFTNNITEIPLTKEIIIFRKSLIKYIQEENIILDENQPYFERINQLIKTEFNDIPATEEDLKRVMLGLIEFGYYFSSDKVCEPYVQGYIEFLNIVKDLFINSKIYKTKAPVVFLNFQKKQFVVSDREVFILQNDEEKENKLFDLNGLVSLIRDIFKIALLVNISNKNNEYIEKNKEFSEMMQLLRDVFFQSSRGKESIIVDSLKRIITFALFGDKTSEQIYQEELNFINSMITNAKDKKNINLIGNVLSILFAAQKPFFIDIFMELFNVNFQFILTGFSLFFSQEFEQNTLADKFERVLKNPNNKKFLKLGDEFFILYNEKINQVMLRQTMLRQNLLNLEELFPKYKKNSNKLLT
jgi:hypothetical protein